MDPITLLGGLLISGGGALIGELLSGPQRAEAEKLLQQARDAYGRIDVPKLQALLKNLPQDSELAKVQLDPRFKEAQMAALGKLGEISDQGGMLLSDKAAENQALNRAQRAGAAGFNRIQEQMDNRGVGNSGATLAMMLHNNDAVAQQAGDIGMQTAANAQARALDAIMRRAELGGKMRAQDYGEQSDLAKARDMIKRYNAQMQYGAAQQDFSNQMAKANGMAGVNNQLYQHQMGAADRTSNTIGGVSHALGSGVQLYGAYNAAHPSSNTPAGYGNYDVSAPVDLSQGYEAAPAPAQEDPYSEEQWRRMQAGWNS